MISLSRHQARRRLVTSYLDTEACGRRSHLLAWELAHLLQSRRVSSVELTERMLTKIYKHDGTIRSFVRVADNARATAEEVDKEIKRGMYKGYLHGIPIAIKDNYLTADMPTRAGTTAPDISFPLIDAAAVTRLRQSGAVLIGKTNMHEFAWGNVTPPTRNPWDIERSAKEL